MSIVRVGRDIFDAARELDFNSIEQEVIRPVRVLIAGRDDLSNRELTRLAFGPADFLSASGSIELLELTPDTRPVVSPGLDLAVLVVPAGAELDASDLTLVATLRAYAIPTILVLLLSSADHRPPTSDAWTQSLPDIPKKRQLRLSLLRGEDVRRELGEAISTLDRHKLPPLAYRFEPLRPCIVEHLVRDSSRTNGEFALVSSLPSLVPLVGGIISSVADLFILTKNQVALVFRIAGIYGRDMSDRTAVLLEVAPVVGGAFLWRTAARSLVALLPAAVSAVPKTLVAYVGTYAVGQMAHYYYREGRRPSPEVLEQIRRDGLQLARRIFNRE
ncbi:MAG TPA: hypothetical protein VHX16_00730 [Chloroflexota bacterium]|nr:hypothetical protein [Chloroflexota bacterium]